MNITLDLDQGVVLDMDLNLTFESGSWCKFECGFESEHSFGTGFGSGSGSRFECGFLFELGSGSVLNQTHTRH